MHNIIQDQKKQLVAKKALKFITPDTIVGVGTGSTVDFFIKELSALKNEISAVVASSLRTKLQLQEHGFEVIDINNAPSIDVYIDGADEVTILGYCIKGGGGAQTKEKIVAAIANKFICIVDESKLVEKLGAEFPLAIEVLPDARSYVGRECLKLGGNPVYRDGFETDSGNIILDIYGLDYTDLGRLDAELNSIVGVVCHGLFYSQRANTILVATDNDVSEIDVI
jgi:ribose 5-phosphate isomerase A